MSSLWRSRTLSHHSPHLPKPHSPVESYSVVAKRFRGWFHSASLLQSWQRTAQPVQLSDPVQQLQLCFPQLGDVMSLLLCHHRSSQASPWSQLYCHQHCPTEAFTQGIGSLVRDPEQIRTPRQTLCSLDCMTILSFSAELSFVTQSKSISCSERVI